MDYRGCFVLAGTRSDTLGTADSEMFKSLWQNSPTPALFDSAPVRELAQWPAQNKRWLTEMHLELCRIAAPTFEEQARAQWMVEQFRLINWEARIDRAGNVVAQRPGQGKAAKQSKDALLTALTAHLDTVLAPRTSDDVVLGRDGRLIGPGVADNGAGLVGLLAFARAVDETPIWNELALPVVLLANVGEEGEGNLSGMRYFCRPASFGARVTNFIVLDGPGMDHITNRALGSRRFEVSISGPGGHSWSDFGTGNPVHAMSRAISMFCDRATDLGGGESAFNFGIIDGGSSVNAIPTSARAKVDLRSENAARIESLSNYLSFCVERALENENAGTKDSSPRRLTAKIREIGSRPAGQTDPGSALLRHLQTVDGHLGIRARLDCSSTDANVPMSMGIPAISIGAGGSGGGAHTPGEWYHPEGREQGLRRVLLLTALLVADSDEETGRALASS
jgi:tripeptide aminopeptidase